MILYLVRHGEAVDETTNPERPLSSRGIQEAALTGQFLKSLEARPHVVFCSDKIRARQTSERIVKELGVSVRIEQRKGLAPKDEPGQFSEELEQMSEDVLIIGHAPFLPRLAGLLLWGQAETEAFQMKPGGLIRLERKGRGTWTLTLSISPADIALAL